MNKRINYNTISIYNFEKDGACLKMLPNGLIVSCQALPDEPLHSSFIMSKMALAAYQGGAVGIRANTKEDILAIREEVSLPVIGIVKRDYEGSNVFITATSKEVDELIESGCEVIALDATTQTRPKESLEDYIGTTLRGYTSYTKGHILFENDFEFLKEVLEKVNAKVIAEGNVITPEMYKKVSDLGVHCTVVGGAITRPKQITERFIEAVQQK